MTRKAEPGEPQYYPVKGVKRSKDAEWKGLVANILCMMIGVMGLLCVQALTGTFNAKPHNRGWEMRDVVLRYFDCRGRAEAIRLLLEEAGIKYTDRRYTREEWAQIKNNTDMFAFNQLPQLEDNGIHFVQSQAILKYIGKSQVHLAGYDVFEDIHADIIAGGAEDFRKKYGALVYDPNFSEEKMKEYLNNVASVHLRQFETQLIRAGKKWFVGDHITYVDFLVWDIIDVHMSMDSECLFEHAALTAWYHRIANRKHIKPYLKSKRRPKNINGPLAYYGNDRTTA